MTSDTPTSCKRWEMREIALKFYEHNYLKSHHLQI